MAWSLSRDITTESNYTNTNMFISPWGTGTPASSAEYNANFDLAAQRSRQIYQDMSPSGFITKVLSVSTLETTTGQDSAGELVSITNNGIPLANTIRLGQSNVSVGGYRSLITNNVGTNGIHNNIVLDTAPTTGSRFDLVFLELFIAELGGTSATISNTANKPSATTIYLYGNTQYNGINATDDISEIDAEINRRWQIQYRIRVVDNVNINSYVDGINDSVNVKAWGTNPNALWSGYAAGTGSAYTFQNNFNGNGDNSLFVAGDGSTTAKSVLGTVDGYVYAIPIAVVFRRNSGIYDPSSNPFGSGTNSSNGNISSGVSGRPDGLYYDQITASDIMSLRHQCFYDQSIDLQKIASKNFEKVVRGRSNASFATGDGLGSPSANRSTQPTYLQEICPTASIDAGYRGLSQFDYQRRTFSDVPVLQQTEFTFKGGSAPDNTNPSILLPPIEGTAATSTASGTLPSGGYSFVLTYVNPYGETTVSPESSTYTLSSSGNLSINSPVSEGNASGWNVYITSTPGSNWKKQNTSTIAIGTNFVQSVALNTATSSIPGANTSSSTLIINADSSGMSNGTATVLCVDGASSPSTGPLPGNKNILVYDAGTLASVTGTWSGLNTATATFIPTGGWTGTTTTNGVVAIVGLNYPGGNGLPIRPNSMYTETLIQGSNVFNMASFGLSGISGADNTHLYNPSGVFVDGSGNIFIADTSNHRVIKLNNALVYQTQFPLGVTGIYGSDNAHLYNPKSIIADTAGNIYVSDSSNHRIVKLNSSLAYVTQFGTTGVSGSDTSHLNTPLQINIDPSNANIYIADSVNNRVVRISLAMSYGATVVSSVAGVAGVAVDASANTYISFGSSYVAKYNPSGTQLLAYGSGTAGSTNYTASSPTSVTLDSNGYIVFADTANHRIVKLNPNFIYVGQMGVTGLYSTDSGRFNSPQGIFVDSNNQLFVADTSNNRMIKIHEEMGGFDPATRTFQVMYSGAPSDKLKFSYSYIPYQGIIGNQGSNSFSYTFKALTDLMPFVTSCGTGAKNANIENELNGLTTRLPLPATYFGNVSPTQQGEYFQFGTNFTGGTIDPSPILTDLPVSWGGSSSTFQPVSPNGNQSANTIAGSQILISQSTGISVLPSRGVNSIERFMGSSYPYNSGYDYLGMSFGSFAASLDHTTYGYFLASCSGGTSTLPFLKGEVVLVVVAFRTNGNVAALYGQPSIASAVDVFRLEERPVVYY